MRELSGVVQRINRRGPIERNLEEHLEEGGWGR